MADSKLLIKSQDRGSSGVFARVYADVVGWDLLNMAALRLHKGERYSGEVGEHEQVTVILGGRCNIRTSVGDYLELGRRANVFEGMPWALYLPRRATFEIHALTEPLEVASCWVPTDQDHQPCLVTPKDCPIEIRGGANATRQINSIIPPGFNCHRLVCVEVYTPSGNWSSYPPHKHDVHRIDDAGKVLEADLDEIYFYKIDNRDNGNGFAYQRVYTSDGGLDELMLARNHDVVLVPEGYHPVVGAQGYTTYYLNFLAGSAQSLANSDDPALAWVKSTWKDKDPRLPLVHLGMEGEK
ncbi:MAG TPA: 5-deoxy-glucuronate isomerase [Aggregatilineales bacterium]|nr:5-deoxy-glucuronate isomerase [Aggregatilineales bacterium]